MGIQPFLGSFHRTLIHAWSLIPALVAQIVRHVKNLSSSVVGPTESYVVELGNKNRSLPICESVSANSLIMDSVYAWKLTLKCWPRLLSLCGLFGNPRKGLWED